jgi:hypothetical protein
MATPTPMLQIKDGQSLKRCADEVRDGVLWVSDVEFDAIAGIARVPIWIEEGAWPSLQQPACRKLLIEFQSASSVKLELDAGVEPSRPFIVGGLWLRDNNAVILDTYNGLTIEIDVLKPEGKLWREPD